MRREVAVLNRRQIQPDFAEKVANAGAGEPYSPTPQEVRLRNDDARYGKVLSDSGLQVE
jgi:hypothetical protein